MVEWTAILSSALQTDGARSLRQVQKDGETLDLSRKVIDLE